MTDHDNDEITAVEEAVAQENLRAAEEHEHKHIGIDFPKAPPFTGDGGWCAPGDQFYPGLDLPLVTVTRGGLSFTAPKPLTKKQLQAQVDRLQPALARAQRENRKLRRKNRRLLKLIARLA